MVPASRTRASGLCLVPILYFLASWNALAQDNMKGSWLCDGIAGSSIPSVRKVDAFLRKAGGSFRPLVCSYGGVVLRSSTLIDRETVKHDGSVWHFSMERREVADQPDAIDLDLSFTLRKGHLKSGGIAAVFDFSNWRTENYVFAPAAVYNGNRYRMMDLGYCAYIKDRKDKPLDMPITITNILHLNIDKSPAKIEMLTGNCATPMMGFYDGKSATGWLMLTEQKTQLGNSGLIIEEDASKGKASFVVSAPGVRERRYVMCGFAESGDAPADLMEGWTIRLRMRLYVFKASSLQQFFDRVFTVRKALSGATSYRQVAPFSAVADIVLDHHDRHKYYEDDHYGYIANHPERDDPFGHLSPGGSVPVWSYPQVIRSTPERLRRVSMSFDAMTHAQAKSGFFYYFLYRGKVVGGDFLSPDLRFSSGGVRPCAEALYFGIQTLELLKTGGNERLVKPAWDEMMKRAADAAVSVWKRYGQFGNTLDVETGEIDIPGSTAGAEFISGLALASRYFRNPEYLGVAEEAGDYYYRRDLSKGYTGGGPGDILLCQDSESANFLSDAYTILYEMTGRQKWLQYAREGAALLSTWVVSYDYQFPEKSRMRRWGTRATGSVWASTQNAHSAPGLYVMSGTFLLKLYRATGDRRYMELLKDIIHNVVQYANTVTNRIIPRSPPGSATERVNLSDWEGADKVGDILDEDSNMAWETVILFSVLQNPGIYLNHETGALFVFDNIDATIVRRGRKNTVLKISNPTPYDASIAILSESNARRKVPLDMYAFTKWDRAEIGAGATKTIRLRNQW
jgi:hypothetical protein